MNGYAPAYPRVVEPDPERGPFRSAAPTPEALLAREREASWARVEQITRALLAEERERERRRDRMAWAAAIASLIVLVAVVVLAMVDRELGAPLFCPALAFFASSVFVVRTRRRVATR